MKKLRRELLDRYFRVFVAIKGLDGLLEMAGGVALIIVPLGRLQGIVAELATREIAEDPHAFIAQLILRLDQGIHPHIQLFAVIYLLGHGAIKVFLAYALLRRIYAIYPIAIGFLLAFVVYQAYRIGFDHSIVLSVLTLLDCVLAWLTYLEWKRHLKAEAK